MAEPPRRSVLLSGADEEIHLLSESARHSLADSKEFVTRSSQRRSLRLSVATSDDGAATADTTPDATSDAAAAETGADRTRPTVSLRKSARRGAATPEPQVTFAPPGLEAVMAELDALRGRFNDFALRTGDFDSTGRRLQTMLDESRL